MCRSLVAAKYQPSVAFTAICDEATSPCRRYAAGAGSLDMCSSLSAGHSPYQPSAALTPIFEDDADDFGDCDECDKAPSMGTCGCLGLVASCKSEPRRKVRCLSSVHPMPATEPCRGTAASVKASALQVLYEMEQSKAAESRFHTHKTDLGRWAAFFPVGSTRSQAPRPCFSGAWS